LRLSIPRIASKILTASLRLPPKFRWQANPQFNITMGEIIKTLQNSAYMGILRERWEEIKKLQKQPQTAYATAI